MAKSVTRPFGVRDKVGYLFGDFGCNLSFQLLSGYLMLYVTQGMGLTTGHWAIIVLVAKQPTVIFALENQAFKHIKISYRLQM